MDMMQPQQGPMEGEDPKALLEQARGLIDKALAAMGGGEEMAEGDKMAADRQNIAREVFGG
jgi:hypothetical protein